MLHDERLEVRTEALLYLTMHAPIDPLERIEELGGFADYSITAGMIAFLAHPGERQNLEVARIMMDTMTSGDGENIWRTKIEAARLIASLPDAFDAQLLRLLRDADPRVAREAAVTVGVLGKQDHAADVILRLRDPLVVPDAQDALVALGESVVDVLRGYLADRTAAREIRREIPELLVRIDTPSAFSALADNLSDPDVRIRFRIITALNKLSQRHPAWRVNANVLEPVVNLEVVGLCRSHQVLAVLERERLLSGDFAAALSDNIRDQTERIFRLLKVMHPDVDLHSAYVGLQSTNVAIHDNALELVEAVLNARLREVLVPLFDGAVSGATRMQTADRVTGIRIDTPADALKVLAESDDEWLRTCAASIDLS
jgi:hypothetical protein